MIILVLLSICRLKSPCLYCPPNHLDKGKSISLLQRVQGCCSLLIIVHDKNLEFTTKLRDCYMLSTGSYILLSYCVSHGSHFYILSTYSNLSTIFQSLSCLLSPFQSCLLLFSQACSLFASWSCLLLFSQSCLLLFSNEV